MSTIKVDTVRPVTTDGSLSLKGDSGGSATTNGISIDSSGNTSVSGQLNADNIRLDGNTISSTDTNGDINLTPDGTGSVIVNGAKIDGYATTSEVQGTHTTGSITSGTTALTVASGTGISNGDYVVGEGITPGTTVSSGGGTTSITLSANANATLSGGSDPVSFYTSTKLLSPGLVAGQLCRAWVNFYGGTSTPYIRASYNVSSITDNGSGDYTVTFTTAMPDVNYCPVFGREQYDAGSVNYAGGIKTTTHRGSAQLMSTAAIRVLAQESDGTNSDTSYFTVAIFR